MRMGSQLSPFFSRRSLSFVAVPGTVIMLVTHPEALRLCKREKATWGVYYAAGAFVHFCLHRGHVLRIILVFSRTETARLLRAGCLLALLQYSSEYLGDDYVWMAECVESF